MVDSSIYANLEIRVFKEEARGYRVEMTLNHSQHFGPGYCNPEELFRHEKGRREWVPSDDPVADGEHLIKCLLCHDSLRQGWEQSQAQGQRRIRLRFDADAPELHAIPWEVLRDSDQNSEVSLAAGTATPLSRYLALPLHPGSPVVQRPLKILVALANPDNLKEKFGLQQLELDVEQRLVEEATETLDVDLKLLPQPCTLAVIEEELRRGYHILHFVGHGVYVPDRGPLLFLADSHNKVKLTPATDPDTQNGFADMVARLLKGSDEKSQDMLRLVYLCSCQSAEQDPADAFRSLAPKLVEVGVPAVLAMQDLVPVPTAQAFTGIFYRHLLEHGKIDQASNEARASVLTAGHHGAQIPVLFSRLADNRLLDIPVGDRAKTIQREYFEPETVLIPAGGFTMGSDPGPRVSEAETPKHPVELHAYRIGKYPVTNEEYADFVRKTKRNVPMEVVGWDGNTPPKDKPRHPVEGITFKDAVDYCEWLSNEVTEERLGRKRTYRLPTEAEWEKAARGAIGRVYPWSDGWQAERCHQLGKESAAVDNYGAQSVYGIYDLVGNVSEWTRTLWGQDPKTPAAEYKHPWKDDARNETTAGNHIRRVVKGGSYGDGRERLRCSARHNELPDKPGLKGKRHGFRVVLAL